MPLFWQGNAKMVRASLSRLSLSLSFLCLLSRIDQFRAVVVAIAIAQWNSRKEKRWHNLMRNTQNEIPWILFNNKQFFRVKSRKFSFSENLNHVEGIFKHEKNYVFHSDIFFFWQNACLFLALSLTLSTINHIWFGPCVRIERWLNLKEQLLFHVIIWPANKFRKSNTKHTIHMREGNGWMCTEHSLCALVVVYCVWVCASYQDT